MLQNNPLMMILNAYRKGGNPLTVLQQMRDPRAQQAIGMLQGKTPQQLESMARNMARERGVSLEDMIRQLNIR